MEAKHAAKCTICSRQSVIEKRHEGRSLCRRHFLESVEKRFRKAVGANRMVASGDRVAIALSGGRDSSVALVLMKGLVAGRRDVGIGAITVDEGVRGQGGKSMKTAKALCRKLKVGHHAFSFRKEFGATLDQKAKGFDDVATLRGVGLRWLLNRKARELGFTKLCMGTNLDDEAESVLMNYMRGDVLRAARLGFVNDRSGDSRHVPRIKPLRLVAEAELELYAKLNDITSCRNAHKDGFRSDVESMLNEMDRRYPGIKYNIVETFDKTAARLAPRGGRLLTSWPRRRLVVCRLCGEPSSRAICKCCEIWRN